MAIGDTDVELQFTNIVANVPVVVGIQNTGVQTEILVRYGIQRYTATLGVDYALIFPVDLLTFQLTPTQSLIDKLTAAGPQNVIFVQRVLPLTSDFDYDNAFVRQKLVDEFNRVWMVLQQDNFRIGLASPVTSWNNRVDDVHMFLSDVTDVGGAPIASPAFTGTPTAPTAAPGNDSTQLATNAFVNAAVNIGVTQNAVTSFNGRQGNVNLLIGDVTGVGGAPTAGPNFTGNVSFAGPVAFTVSPTAPTPITADVSTKLATTAFVNNAVAAVSSGVVSWNTRVGVVTMTLADVTGVGGAAASAIPIASSAIPIIDGTGIAGVATTWARGDHVHPTDTSRAPLASPAFTGTPTTATTPTAGDSTTKLATTAFVGTAVGGAFFPSGTLMLFQQTAAPTGWTKQSTHDNKALRVVSGTAGSGGASAFTTVFGQTVTGGYSLLGTDLPAHSHTINHTHTLASGGTDSQGSHAHLFNSTSQAARSDNTGQTVIISGAVGIVAVSMIAAGAHSHGVTGTTTDASGGAVSGNGPGTSAAHSHSMTMNVQYVDLIIASKN